MTATTTLARLDALLKPWIWLFVPGILLHEATHYLVAWPVAEVVTLDPGGEIPTVRMVWDPDTAPWVIVTAHLAPTALGWVVGSAGVVVVLAGVAPVLSPVAWGYVAVNWIALSYPGGEDRAPVGLLAQ